MTAPSNQIYIDAIRKQREYIKALDKETETQLTRRIADKLNIGIPWDITDDWLFSEAKALSLPTPNAQVIISYVNNNVNDEKYSVLIRDTNFANKPTCKHDSNSLARSICLVWLTFYNDVDVIQ